MYCAGKTLHEMAEALGCPPRFLRNHCENMGMPLSRLGRHFALQGQDVSQTVLEVD